ncbi:MAG: beta-ketoacyl-ACP synthase III, partial [Desulfatirhabdiaceae bacterium]
LPNAPVTNDAIEEVLGKVNGIASRARRIVLNSNQIKQRYYALDPESGRLTHTNARLTAEAIRRLRPHAGFSPDQIACLCCGTTSPDLMFPGHALMVQGELELEACEAVSTSGICLSGMTAFKYAFLNVAAGLVSNAVAAGSELASSYMRERFLTPFYKELPDLETRPERAFDADFLRWMLSDGAGAAFLSAEKNREGLSLKVDWMEVISYAGKLETCMYAGGVKQADGGVVGWRDIEAIAPESMPHRFSVRQDIKLLDREIVRTMGAALSTVIQKRGLSPDAVDWFLPHYSSYYFRPKFYEEMTRIGFEISYSRWFSNLSEKGNTGSAAIYIIIEELFHSGRLETGQKLLCFIPESGRFSHAFVGLTVV